MVNVVTDPCENYCIEALKPNTTIDCYYMTGKQILYTSVMDPLTGAFVSTLLLGVTALGLVGLMICLYVGCLTNKEKDPPLELVPVPSDDNNNTIMS